MTGELPPGFEDHGGHVVNGDGREEPEVEYFAVDLPKDSHGLGITIAGYVGEEGTGACVSVSLRVVSSLRFCVTSYCGVLVFARVYVCDGCDVDVADDLTGIFVRGITEGSATTVDGRINVNYQHRGV